MINASNTGHAADTDSMQQDNMGKDINALFARLNPQDVEQFYKSYQLWTLQQQMAALQTQIAALQEEIAINGEMMQQVQPSAIVLSSLAQLQASGVTDTQLLDKMCERGEAWLDHTLQLLAYCERFGVIRGGNYTEWCEHALEGAYDWINSVNEASSAAASVENAAVEAEAPTEAKATEELLLQKLMSEDDETIKLPSVDFLRKKTRPLSESDLSSQPEVPASEETSASTLTTEDAGPLVESAGTLEATAADETPSVIDSAAPKAPASDEVEAAVSEEEPAASAPTTEAETTIAPTEAGPDDETEADELASEAEALAVAPAQETEVEDVAISQIMSESEADEEDISSQETEVELPAMPRSAPAVRVADIAIFAPESETIEPVEERAEQDTEMELAHVEQSDEIAGQAEHTEATPPAEELPVAAVAASGLAATPIEENASASEADEVDEADEANDGDASDVVPDADDAVHPSPTIPEEALSDAAEEVAEEQEEEGPAVAQATSANEKYAVAEAYDETPVTITASNPSWRGEALLQHEMSISGKWASAHPSTGQSQGQVTPQKRHGFLWRFFAKIFGWQE
jgi:hypothetical protein